MKHYAGLDVRQQTTSICIVDEEGAVVAERKVATCPDAIAAMIEPFAPARVGLETGPLSVWLWNQLKARGCQSSAWTRAEDGHGVSVKLSALCPGYEARQEARVWAELYPRVKRLALIAARHDLNFAIDAEEADRLVFSLDPTPPVDPARFRILSGVFVTPYPDKLAPCKRAFSSLERISNRQADETAANRGTACIRDRPCGLRCSPWLRP